MTPNVQVSGQVLTKQGWGIEGATVTLLGGTGQQLGRAVCDGQGAFTMDAVPSGAATLLVAAPSHQPKVQAISIPRVAEWDVGDLRLSRTGVTNTPPPGTYTIDPAHSSVRARAHHFGLGGVSGGFERFSGVIHVAPDAQQSSVDVTIETDSIHTGNEDRDTHLKSADFLDVTTQPTMHYVCDGVAPAGEAWIMEGRLTLLGVTRPVRLTMEYLGCGPDSWGGTRAAFTASTTLKRQDFNVNWNQAVAAGIDAIGTTLQVTIEVEAVLT